MRQNFSRLFVVVLILTTACSEGMVGNGKFSSGQKESSQTSPGVTVDPSSTDSTQTSTGTNSSTSTDTNTAVGGPGGPINTTDGSIHLLKKCTQGEIFFANHGSKCPAHSAAYAIDDPAGDGSGIYVSCCPLPARDILVGDQMVRGNACGSDEVATGSAGPNQFYCSKINLNRYVLSSPKQTCYNGSGATGGGGATTCGAPPAILTLMVEKFGTDACMGFPFGSLIVDKIGKPCSTMHARQLLFKDTNKPVEMLKQ